MLSRHAAWLALLSLHRTGVQGMCTREVCRACAPHTFMSLAVARCWQVTPLVFLRFVQKLHVVHMLTIPYLLSYPAVSVTRSFPKQTRLVEYAY